MSVFSPVRPKAQFWEAYRQGVIYESEINDGSAFEPSLAILRDGQLYVGGKRCEDTKQYPSTLHAAGVSVGLNGERIERFREVGTWVILRRITAAGQTWWDVDHAGGES